MDFLNLIDWRLALSIAAGITIAYVIRGIILLPIWMVIHTLNAIAKEFQERK